MAEGEKTIREWGPWALGLLLLSMLLIGLALPAIPFLGGIAAAIIGLMGIGGALGVAIAAGVLFMAPKIFQGFAGAKRTLETGSAILLSLVKAAVFAGIAFLLGYFVMPWLLGLLAAKVTALAFLGAMSHGGTLSLVMLSISSAFSFFSTLWKGPLGNLIKDTPHIRTAEFAFGTVSIAGAIVLLLGVAPLAAPIALALGTALAFLGALSTLGFFSMVYEVYKDNASDKSAMPPIGLEALPPPPVDARRVAPAAAAHAAAAVAPDAALGAAAGAPGWAAAAAAAAPAPAPEEPAAGERALPLALGGGAPGDE